MFTLYLTALEELWKEVALSQLLTIVDIPFIDTLLIDEKTEKKQMKQSLIVSNMVTKHWNMPTSGEHRVSDPFMSTALSCIECLPNGLAVLENQFVRESDVGAKIQAYHHISQHYTQHQEEPLLPATFIDLHLAILNLILKQQDDKALEALQMDVILLPWYIREELHRMLLFMSAATKEDALQLDPKDDNETLMLNTFTDCILRHKVIAQKLACILVGFMVRHVDSIFNVPKMIRNRVNARIDDLKTGEVSPVRDNTYCAQVTSEEYSRQAEDCTTLALIDMMNGILDNTSMSLKEKKQRCRQFQKCHPKIYTKHFSTISY